MLNTLTRLFRPKPAPELAPDFKAGHNASWHHRWNAYRDTAWRDLALQSIVDECSETGPERFLWAACIDALADRENDVLVDEALADLAHEDEPEFDPDDIDDIDDTFWRDSIYAERAGMGE